MIEIFNNPEDNQRINDFYCTNKNYCEQIVNPEGKYIYIFFSSHGIYYPSTYARFSDRVVKSDYYEWKNISKAEIIAKYAYKCIFVRDIYKHWYFWGINSEINSFQRLISLCKSFEEDGKKLVCVGNSAGSYAAIIVGLSINAYRVFAFSPQVDLDIRNRFHIDGPLDEVVAAGMRRCSVEDLLRENKNTEILYFYPTKVDEDLAQYAKVREFSNRIKFFPIVRDKHGSTIYPDSTIRILSMDDDQLNNIVQQYKGRNNISAFSFMVTTSGFVAACKYMCNKLMRKLKKSK